VESILTAHPSLYRVIRPTLMTHHFRGKGDKLSRVIRRTHGGGILITHILWTEDWEKQMFEHPCVPFFCIRDPRDTVISEAYYITKSKKHPFHQLFQSVPAISDRIRLAITGDKASGYPSLLERVEPFLPWLQTPVLTVRFEDLVGDAGGGSDEVQEKVVTQIFDLLNLDGVDQILKTIRTPRSRSGSPTFRKGSIQQWKEDFDEDLLQFFVEHAGALPERMGYEPSVFPE